MLSAAIETGVTDYVLKPLVPERIFAAIAKCLRVAPGARAAGRQGPDRDTCWRASATPSSPWTGDGASAYLNPGRRSHSTSPAGLPGELLPGPLPGGYLPDPAAFQEAMAATGVRSFEHYTAGPGRWHEARVFPLGGGVSVYLRDITETKAGRGEDPRPGLLRQAHRPAQPHPPAGAARAAIQIRRRSRERCAVLFIDLDAFKNINDSLGHEAGDEVLQEVARRLCACIRESDTAARLGGDEFVVLLEGFDQPDNIHAVTNRILLALAQDIRLGDQLSVTASIGISFFPEDGETVEDLLKAADTAMYHGKKRGRNTYQFYRKEMNAGTRQFLLMGHALRQAAEQQEFILHYQPQYALESRALIGFEALVRWRHPDLGLIPPAEFLPLAEDSGFISQLGEWIFRQACHQGRLWLDQNQGPLRMAVKLTGRQFWQENLVDRLRQALVDSGLPPSCLELEIAESHLTAQPDLASTRLRELAALGRQAGHRPFRRRRHLPVRAAALSRPQPQARPEPGPWDRRRRRWPRAGRHRPRAQPGPRRHGRGHGDPGAA